MPSPSRIGPHDRLPEDERFIYPRYLGFRPADGQVCDLNPPRSSWPFGPETIPRGPLPAGKRFDLRIGPSPELVEPTVEVSGTLYNFYNVQQEVPVEVRACAEALPGHAGVSPALAPASHTSRRDAGGPRNGSDGFRYALGRTRVEVRLLGETGPLTIENMSGEDWYRNPVTGEDRFPEARERVARRRELSEVWDGCPRVHNNLWVTTEPRHEAQFLGAILPHRDREPEPSARKLAPEVIEVTVGRQRDIISFGPDREDALVVVDHLSLR